MDDDFILRDDIFPEHLAWGEISVDMFTLCIQSVDSRHGDFDTANSVHPSDDPHRNLGVSQFLEC